MKLKPINEQVVVVMGASSGIGRATALRFAEGGAKVVAAARGEEGLRSLVEEIRARGGDAIAVRADTSDFDQVKEVADTAASVYGRIDTWAHVAGTTVIASFEEHTPEEFRRVVDVNLMGQVYGAMAALPYLRRGGGGALVHVSSVEARISMPYQSAYTASKHGVEGFVDALRVELAREGVPISVTNIMPGPINTPIFDKARTKIGVKPTVPSPVYDAHAVADAILHAAEHPVRHTIVGGVSACGVALQAIAPSVMDLFLKQFGMAVQVTNEPKRADAPSNLFEPIGGYDTVRGSVDAPTRRTSTYAALDRHPAARRTVAALAVGATLVGLARLARGARAKNST